MKRYE